MYGFGGSWKAIAKYNFFKGVIATENDKKLPIGTSLLIPRTEEQYEKAISGMKTLLNEIELDEATLLKELNDYRREADHVGTSVDIVADFAFAYKGAIKAGIKLGPRYAEYVLRKETLKAVLSAGEKIFSLGESNEGLIVKSTGKAVVDQAILLEQKRIFDAKKAKLTGIKDIGKAYAKKTAVGTAKAIVPIEIAEWTGEIVDIICDAAIASGKGLINAVEAVSPSKIAKQWVAFRSGEHPYDTHELTNRKIIRTFKKSRERLQDAIKKLVGEKNELYSSGKLECGSQTANVPSLRLA